MQSMKELGKRKNIWKLDGIFDDSAPKYKRRDGIFLPSFCVFGKTCYALPNKKQSTPIIP